MGVSDFHSNNDKKSLESDYPLLCVLCMVLHGSPKNVARVAHDVVNVQFVRLFKLCTKHVTDFFQLIGLISQSSNDPMVQGVAAFLLGICTYMYAFQGRQ